MSLVKYKRSDLDTKLEITSKNIISLLQSLILRVIRMGSLL